jgi:hypothetical protein
MPPVRSLASKHLAYRFKLVAVILLLSKIMPSCSHCAEKGLVYIVITALFSQQPSFHSEYTKLNMHLSYNIHSIFNAECICLAARLCTL